jgi:hypothetical protein
VPCSLVAAMLVMVQGARWERGRRRHRPQACARLGGDEERANRVARPIDSKLATQLATQFGHLVLAAHFFYSLYVSLVLQAEAPRKAARPRSSPGAQGGRFRVRTPTLLRLLLFLRGQETVTTPPPPSPPFSLCPPPSSDPHVCRSHAGGATAKTRRGANVSPKLNPKV